MEDTECHSPPHLHPFVLSSNHLGLFEQFIICIQACTDLAMMAGCVSLISRHAGRYWEAKILICICTRHLLIGIYASRNQAVQNTAQNTALACTQRSRRGRARESGTSIKAKIGASMRHVEIHAACPIGIAQYLAEDVHHIFGAVVGHPLAPVRQPACAANDKILTQILLNQASNENAKLAMLVSGML